MKMDLVEPAERPRHRVSVRTYNLGSRAVEGIRLFPPRSGPDDPDLSPDPAARPWR